MKEQPQHRDQSSSGHFDDEIRSGAEGPLSMSPPAFGLTAAPAQMMNSGVIQRSALSEELQRIYIQGGSSAVFQHIRALNRCIADQDAYAWVDRTFLGDDHWFCTNLLAYGVETGWPLRLRIELQMKAVPGAGGREGVMRLLRDAAGSLAGSADVATAIRNVFPSQSLDRWLALTLQERGNEANFTLKEKIIQWYLEHNELTALTEINARGLNVVTFTGAFDKWLYDDGHEEITDLSNSLRGNSSGTTIRLNAALSPSDAATTLFHEVQHQVVEGLEYLDEEIEVRRRTEEMAIRTGLPETRPGYRNSDGSVNQQAIENSVRGSSHYNPTGRTRIDRWYEGETNTGSWTLP